MSVDKKKLEEFDAIIKSVNKNFKTSLGDKILMKLSDRPRKVPTIPTGSLVLDSLLGGGFPVGRIIEIYGPAGSGKTSVALNATGYVQHHNGIVVYIDLENALDPTYAYKLGVDLENLVIAQPDSAETALNLMIQLGETGAVDLIVLDSVAALVSKNEMDASLEDTQRPGEIAKLLSRALPKLVPIAAKNKCTMIFINQLREKVGVSFGSPEVTSGGKALAYYASQRIDVRKTGMNKDNSGEVNSTVVKLKIAKNKIAPPFKTGETVLTFGHGIDKPAELLAEGSKPQYNVISKPNNRTYVEAETGEVIGTSKASALDRLNEDKELFDRLSNALRTKIEESFSIKELNKEETVLGTESSTEDTEDESE